jgi:hypothetical protein
MPSTFKLNFLLSPLDATYPALDPDGRHAALEVAWGLMEGWIASDPGAVDSLLTDIVIQESGPFAVDYDPLKSELINRVAATQASLPGALQGLGLVYGQANSVLDGWIYLPPWVCDHSVATNKQLHMKLVAGVWTPITTGTPDVSFLLRLNAKCADCQNTGAGETNPSA